MRRSGQPKTDRTNNSHVLLASVGIPVLLLTSGIAGFVGASIHDKLYTSNTVGSQQTVISAQETAVAGVAKQVGPSVVSIVTSSTAQTIFGYNVQQQGAGTGIVISDDGYVVTNKHVVSGATSDVQIIAADGTQYKSVKLVGVDPTNDIAFLKINNVKDLPAARLGDSSKVEVGQNVVAIGNALGEYQNTVTSGIISALSRPIVASDGGSSAESLDDLLQTDAAINPGNSGGPLVNLSGEVIGINTAVASNAQGIGFAIPINDVKGMVKTLLATGKIEKPFVGVRYAPLTPAVVKQLNLGVQNGALIYANNGSSGVVSGSPAEKAGLQDNDVITKVDSTPIDRTHSFSSVAASYSVGDTITLTVVRDGKTLTIPLTLGTAS